MKHLEFNRFPKQALFVRDVDKQERLDRHYRSVALHTSLAHIHHQLVSPQWKKNNRSSTLSIFHSQRTPFSCFPFVFLLSPGFWYVGFGTNRIGSLCHTLPNIDWNNEDHVSSLTAHKLRLYLKQHNLQVSGGKATLVALVLRYVWAAHKYRNLKTMPQQVTLSCWNRLGTY